MVLLFSNSQPRDLYFLEDEKCTGDPTGGSFFGSQMTLLLFEISFQSPELITLSS